MGKACQLIAYRLFGRQNSAGLFSPAGHEPRRTGLYPPLATCGGLRQHLSPYFANNISKWQVIRTNLPDLTTMKSSAKPIRPASVLNALRVLVLCLGIELLGFAFSGGYSTGRLVGVIVGSLLLFWLLRQVHARLNWARYALIVLIGLSVLASVISFGPEYGQHPGETVIGVFSVLLSLLSAVLLFTKESNAWFDSARPA